MVNNYVSAFCKVAAFPHYSKEHQKKIRNDRLKSLVQYAKKNSPFFAEFYKNIGEDFTIDQLPVLTKQLMMEIFDTFHTDSRITRKSVDEYFTNGNAASGFLDGYNVISTTGSTGYPAIIVQDMQIQKVSAALSFLRGIGMKLPLALVFIDDGFGIDNVEVAKNTAKFPIMSKFIRTIDAARPYEEIVKDLAEFKPKTVIGYTGLISILSKPEYAKAMNIHPSNIIVSGEYMSEGTRERIAQAFSGASVHTMYGCTEAGTMAYECKNNHLHICDDWVILEPVDENNRPVKNGEMSKKVLLTVLSNYVTPIIRYEVTDSIAFHDERCECGNQFPYISVEGRANAPLTFRDKKGSEVEISAMILFDAIDTYVGKMISNYQLILGDNNDFELRVEFLPDSNKDEIVALFKKAITKHLAKHNIAVTITLSDAGPDRNQRTGKFLQIYQCGRVLETGEGRLSRTMAKNNAAKA